MSRRDTVGKLLLSVGALAAALALGRCWGVRSAQPVSAPGDAAPPPAAAAASPLPTVALHLDAGDLRLLPDAAIQLQPMPQLDPRKLYRSDDGPDVTAAPPTDKP